LGLVNLITWIMGFSWFLKLCFSIFIHVFLLSIDAVYRKLCWCDF
jgi:hypothetical protein